MATQTDVAIIGGGIVGLATAYRLLERFPGTTVTILEKEANDRHICLSRHISHRLQVRKLGGRRLGFHPDRLVEAKVRAGSGWNPNLRTILRRHLRDFVDLAVLVVGRPLADLLAVLKRARTQLGPVFPEPFPIPGHDITEHLPQGERAIGCEEVVS